MSNEFDIHEFARLFDAALASDNPSVKKALRNFMMVASIVEAENTDDSPLGPLGQVLEHVEIVKERLLHLEEDFKRQQASDSMYKNYKKQYTGTWPETYLDDGSNRYTSTWTSNKTYFDNDMIKKLLDKGAI